MRVDPVGHEGGDGARRVVLARVAGRLQVIENLLVDVAEVLTLGEVVEIDRVDPIHDLPHELARFHVVVGVLEHVAHDAPAVSWLRRSRKVLERREQFAIDEGEEFLARDALGVRRPGAPLVFRRDRRAVVAAQEFEFLVLIVDDLQEEHPAQLADALCIAIDAGILAHDVLDGFDGGADGHGLTRIPDRGPTANRGQPDRSRLSRRMP